MKPDSWVVSVISLILEHMQQRIMRDSLDTT